MIDYLNIDNHSARPLDPDEEGIPFDARCTGCGDPECYENDQYTVDGLPYCEPCWDDMERCQWCEEKIAPKEPAVAVADDCQYHEQCFVDYVAQEPEDARETIPELDQFLAAISARRAR